MVKEFSVRVVAACITPCVQLVALLREVKYLKQLEGTDHAIPESAAMVYAQSETYRKFVQNLDVIVSLYNRCVCVCVCGGGGGVYVEGLESM